MINIIKFCYFQHSSIAVETKALSVWFTNSNTVIIEMNVYTRSHSGHLNIIVQVGVVDH